MTDNTLIRVADHDGQSLIDRGIMTQTESVYIQHETLEDALRTNAGRVLLRILKAVDYAGAQRRPIMLIGRKQSNGGFMLHVTVPHQEGAKAGPPEMSGNGSPGHKHGKTSKRGMKFMAT